MGDEYLEKFREIQKGKYKHKIKGYRGSDEEAFWGSWGFGSSKLDDEAKSILMNEEQRQRDIENQSGDVKYALKHLERYGKISKNRFLGFFQKNFGEKAYYRDRALTFLEEQKKILSGMKEKKSDKVYIASLANKLMKQKLAIGSHDPESTVLGARLYELIGRGNRSSVKRRLLRVFEENPNIYSRMHMGFEAEDFLKRNSSSSGIEHKAITAMSLLSIVVGLFFLYPSITGAAIGAINQSGFSIFGVILFILGLLGIFISLRA